MSDQSYLRLMADWPRAILAPMTDDKIAPDEPVSPIQAAYAAGVAAYNQGQFEAAAAHLSRAALLAPAAARVQSHLGVALRRLRKPEAAIACYRRALTVRPQDASLWSNLGNAFRDIDRLGDAEHALRRAIALDPAGDTFAFNLALVLRDRRQLEEAQALFEGLVDRNPARADYLWDLALTRLQRGDYSSGFAGYEARWGLQRSPPRNLPGQKWSGEELAGKTLFLHAEQGFGDALQFIRFVPLVKRPDNHIVVECMPELRALFAAIPGIDAVVEKGAALPAYEYWLPMLSLPHILGTTIETLPRQVPYLRPPAPAKPLPIPNGTRLKVGLCWAGKTTPRDRSWPLELLMALMGDPGIAFYSLQKGDRRADIATLGAAGLIVDLADELKDFAATAAIMAEMDLIITIDTAIAHLAGALGRPCWVLLRYVSDWRWFDEPSQSIWYPSMTLFRQANTEDWAGPVGHARQALARFKPETSG